MKVRRLGYKEASGSYLKTWSWKNLLVNRVVLLGPKAQEIT